MPMTEEDFKKYVLAMCGHANGDSKSYLKTAGILGGLSEEQCRKVLKEMLEQKLIYIVRRDDWYKTT